MTGMTLFEIAAALSERRISSVELTGAYIERIRALDGDLNAYVTVAEEEAYRSAKASDERRTRKESLGMLDGVPFSVKDNVCVEGLRTTCASRMLENFVPPYTATAVRRLMSSGAVLLGKLNMDEFAMGSASDTSFFGAVKNPLDPLRTAGGSSGGSAAAVAAKMAAFTLGTDTGGSIRQPSAFCGVVGLKPTYGAVSRYGLISFASSLEQIGPISATVEDNAAVFSAICGEDTADFTTLRGFRFNGGRLKGVEGLRIGVCLGAEGRVEESILAALYGAASTLGELGARTSSASLPDGDVAVAAYYIISASEASSNLGRYDGVAYGHRAENAGSVSELFTKSRTEGFGDEVKRRIILGTFCLDGEGRDDHYEKALLAKSRITAEMDSLFEKYDAVIAPVSPSTAYRFADKKKRPIDVYRDDGFAVIANIAGIPSLCVPVGMDSEGMPVGIQIMCPRGREDTAYAVGLALEATEGGGSNG